MMIFNFYTRLDYTRCSSEVEEKESRWFLAKAKFAQEGIFFALQLFAWQFLLIKKLEIKEIKPTFIISVLKIEY